jgi:hypothetical protein
MSKLTRHIESGSWSELYSSNERGHALSFMYNVVRWLERDKADRLVVENDQFIWFRNDVQAGLFPLTIPQPTPPFVELLNSMIKQDEVIGAHLEPRFDHPNTYNFRSTVD